MNRVIVYVDGSNLYFGLRSKCQTLYRNQIMNRLFVGLLAFLAFSLYAAPEGRDRLVLSPSSLGPLELRPGATISEARLRKLFPSDAITYRIEHGDSPSFHHFIVNDPQGNTLFAIRSFLKDSDKHEKVTSDVPIHLLTIHSNKILDSYGLRIGDKVADIIAKRGKDMKVGGGHFDVFMGNGQIFYSLKVKGHHDLDRLTFQDAVKGNWRIRMISWPEGAWE